MSQESLSKHLDDLYDALRRENAKPPDEQDGEYIAELLARIDETEYRLSLDTP